MNKGSYLLIVKVKKNVTIKVGRLGEIVFNPGYYIYVGSAMNNLVKRVKRHFDKNKKIRWHIDYLTSKIKPEKAILIPSNEKIECLVAKQLAKYFSFISNFGCSDCSCESHLFYSKSYPRLDKILRNAGFNVLVKLVPK